MRVIVYAVVVVGLFFLALGMIAIPRDAVLSMSTGLVVLPMADSHLEADPGIELQSARPPSGSGREPVPSSGQGPFNTVDHTTGGLNPTTLHVFDGTEATRQLPPTTGRVFHHIYNPGYPDHTTYTWLVHVASGPEKTRVIRTDMVHGAIQGPDYTRYFPPGWSHKNFPGPHQTVYVGPDWYHQALTTMWLPPGGGFGGTGFHGSEPGLDQTDLIGPGGFHIFESPDQAQNSTYVWGPGLTDATHIKYGPDTTRYAPHEHKSVAGPLASSYAPAGWDHITAGPFATTWHPPGWEHKALGPNTTNYLPGDYFHATLSPPSSNGGGLMEPEDSATNYLPPGWFHVSNSDYGEYTTYVPPGFFHATEWGGTWPNPGVGLNPGGRLRVDATDYVSPGTAHIFNPSSPDHTRYAPGTGNSHVNGGPDDTYYVPNDWIHQSVQGFSGNGKSVPPSSYTEPGWQHSTSPEAEHGPTTYVFNP